MTQKISWEKIYHAQKKSGWCGPAVVQMVLAYAGIRKSQKTIAKDIYFPWWGTTNHALIAYLSHFFKKHGSQSNSSINELEKHLKNKHLIIVNWWDDIDSKTTPDGHYSLVISIDLVKKEITLADPSRSRGIWSLKITDFEKNWYDYLDTQKQKLEKNWFLWLDSKSKILKKGNLKKLY